MTPEQENDLIRHIHNTLDFCGKPYLAMLEWLNDNDIPNSLQAEQVYIKAMETYSNT